MLAKERHDRIYNILKSNKSISTTELAALLNVSIETIRRDLLELERNGLLQRVYGGAILSGEMMSYPDLPHRIESNKEDKAELCEIAALLVNDGDTIAIDTGSTAIHFAEALNKRNIQLTVVTHSLAVVDILSHNDNVNLIVCGGLLLKKENCFYGQLTLDTMEKLHVQKSFIFPSAISLQNGICDFNHDLYPIQKQLLTCADNIYFLLTSNKFERHGLLKICDVDTSYTYISDSELDEAYIQLYKGKNIKIITKKEDIDSYDVNE